MRTRSKINLTDIVQFHIFTRLIRKKGYCIIVATKEPPCSFIHRRLLRGNLSRRWMDLRNPCNDMLANYSDLRQDVCS